MCILGVHLKVVSHDLSVLSLSVMGFLKKNGYVASVMFFGSDSHYF